MKQILFVLILSGCCMAGFSQTGKIIGSVQDVETRTGLELATINVLKEDSSLLMYRLSDKNGFFSLEKLPLKKKLLVSVTYTGYVGYYATIQVDKEKDTLAVLLTPNYKDTQAIVISTTVPIRMNGDTLEINPAGIKTDKNAVVEELLNQVSGITIWSDGTITVNGKKVQNLLVDGKPFLGSTDTRVATQNLPKTAIDKIQLYHEYDRSQISSNVQPRDSLLIMNIKLKEASKKGYFGKAGAGYGTTDRFEADLSFQLYNKKSSAGLAGGMNNINKNIGNLGEMFQNNTYRNFNPNLYSVGRFGANGTNKNHSLGAVVTHNFIETTNSRQNNQITVNYNTSGTDAFTSDLHLQNRTTIASPQVISEVGSQNNSNKRHAAGITYSKSNSYNDNLNANGMASTSSDRGISSRFTEVRDTANVLQSTNAATTVQNGQSNDASLYAGFAKADEDDPLKNFSIQLNATFSDNESESITKTNFESLTDGTKNTSHNRRYSSTSDGVNINGSFDYAGFKRLLLGRYNLFEIQLNFLQLFDYNRSSDKNLVGDYDSASKQYIANHAISSLNKKEAIGYTPTLSLSKSFSKWVNDHSRSIYLHLRLAEEFKKEKNESSIKDRNLDRSFQFFRYDGNAGYQYSKQEKYQYHLSLNYNRSFQYPSVDQLYTIVDDINAYEIRIGNPNLQNRINHSVRLNGNFNTNNSKSTYVFTGHLSGALNRSINPVVDSVHNDLSGKRISYYTNADKSSSFNVNYSANLSKRIKQSQLQISYNGQFGTSSSPNYIDGVYNVSNTSNLLNQVTIQFSLRTILVLNLVQSFQRYTSKQAAAGLTSSSNKSSNTRASIVLNYPTNFSFSSTIDRVDNSNLARSSFLWNSFVTYRFMKQQGELKISAMDILKQYKNIINSVNAYGTSTTVINGLQQFFMVTFSYFPRYFGKTEIKRQSQGGFQ